MSPRAARKTASPLPERLRRLPSVDDLLGHERLRALADEVGRALVVVAARQVLAGLRGEIRRGLAEAELAVRLAHVDQEVTAETRELLGLSLGPVINATGVVLHTNLGRAPLSRAAAQRVAAVATGYSNLEFDLGRGARGRRDVHAAKFLDRLLGAEASLVVNNNAAAVLLALNTLAGTGGEVVVSRGELIEIGESFRIPDILARSGARLVEVGTTNRTRLADYARAITRQTRLVLRVHPSNFRLVGFTERPALEELVQLARRKRLPLVEDLGSGLLVDLAPQGLDEPLAAASLAAGVDLVTFSGDKLLGGPQAGILAGKKKLVEACRRNPLFRALRVDKMTYAALEATLASYLRGAADEVPAVRMIRLTADEIGARAEALRAELAPALAGRGDVSVRAGESVAGGGSTPGAALATKLLVIAPRAMSAAELAARLRRPDASGRPPVVARVEADRVLFDLRTVFPEQEAALAAALRAALRD